ncbi:septin-7-like isoform X2 [Panonychus citri]|uniref:septin-7-like isoform X2 n=1 Tax=Panonychus citri TaxID=50023 RepID=UPI002307D095|nr:septin-7-like isoform X2 [Panonychus citri]
MVAGWEQQLTHNNLANRSPSTLLTPTSPYPENGPITNPLPPNPSTSINTPSSTITNNNNATSLLSSSPTPSSSVTPTLGKPSIGSTGVGTNLSPNSANLGIKSAREAFFSDPNQSQLSDITKTTNNIIDTPPSPQLTPSTLMVSPLITSKPSARFASVDRLTGRQKIYDQPSEMRSPSPEPSVVEDGEPLNSKRDLYSTRDISQNSVNSSTDSILNSSSALSSSTRNALSGSKTDLLYSRSRSLYRDTLDSAEPRRSMLSSSTNQQDKLMAAKDSERNVGFSDLPNQIHRKTIKKGFEFTLMVVGESELGKSTLVNSMFLTDIYSDEYPGPSKRLSKTVEVNATKVNLKEKNVNLSLTIVDTPGFGDSLDNTNSWQKISEYIEDRYEEYLNAETKLHRTHIPDNRVHCCLYFMLPRVTLRAIDIEFMKNLQDKVNIIPIIAKADSLTVEECQQMKKNVMNQIAQHKIRIYEFPDCDEEDDAKLLKQLKARIPFAVCGSNVVVETPSGERKRARKYPWGTIEIDNLEHCDFIALRMMLIKYFMLDLVDTTNNVHYENYRCRKLSGVGSEKSSKDINPLAQMEEERKASEAKLRRLEQEMDHVFETKVKAKEQKLEEMEAEILRFDEQNRKVHEKELQELADKRAAFEKERDAFEVIAREMEEMRKNTLEANIREKPDLRRSTSSLSSRKSLNLGFKTMKQIGIWRPH